LTNVHARQYLFTVLSTRYNSTTEAGSIGLQFLQMT